MVVAPCLDNSSSSNTVALCNHFPLISRRYVEEDLKKGLGKEPAKVLSARPMDDPLEIIMYMTR